MTPFSLVHGRGLSNFRAVRNGLKLRRVGVKLRRTLGTSSKAQFRPQVWGTGQHRRVPKLIDACDASLKDPFWNSTDLAILPGPTDPPPACLIAIPLGAAVITPNGNNGASLTAGGHIDLPQFRVFVRRGSWTNLYREAGRRVSSE